VIGVAAAAEFDDDDLGRRHWALSAVQYIDENNSDAGGVPVGRETSYFRGVAPIKDSRNESVTLMNIIVLIIDPNSAYVTEDN